MFGKIVLVILVLILIALIATNIRIVPQAKAYMARLRAMRRRR